MRAPLGEKDTFHLDSHHWNLRHLKGPAAKDPQTPGNCRSATKIGTLFTDLCWKHNFQSNERQKANKMNGESVRTCLETGRNIKGISCVI